jgi:hypothetical protein
VTSARRRAGRPHRRPARARRRYSPAHSKPSPRRRTASGSDRFLRLRRTLDILAYGTDLIIAAYILVVAAAIIFTVRRRMSPVKTVSLLIGLAVLGYIAKDTFAPLPAPPYNWDVLAAGITLATGIALPFVYPPLRRGIENSPLLKAGASALLGSRPRSDR